MDKQASIALVSQLGRGGVQNVIKYTADVHAFRDDELQFFFKFFCLVWFVDRCVSSFRKLFSYLQGMALDEIVELENHRRCVATGSANNEKKVDIDNKLFFKYVHKLHHRHINERNLTKLGIICNTNTAKRTEKTDKYV